MLKRETRTLFTPLRPVIKILSDKPPFITFFFQDLPITSVSNGEFPAESQSGSEPTLNEFLGTKYLWIHFLLSVMVPGLSIIGVFRSHSFRRTQLFCLVGKVAINGNGRLISNPHEQHLELTNNFFGLPSKL